MGSVPLLHNMSMMPRTTVDSRQQPVWGAAPTLLDLAATLVALGLLDEPADPAPDRPARLRAQARRRWRGSLTRLLDEAQRAGRLDRARLDGAPRGGAPEGVLIGWLPLGAADPATPQPCADLTLTIAMLERCVGNLYIGARAPQRRWDHLFTTTLCVDDPRLAPTQVRAEARSRAGTTAPAEPRTGVGADSPAPPTTGPAPGVTAAKPTGPT